MADPNAKWMAEARILVDRHPSLKWITINVDEPRSVPEGLWMFLAFLAPCGLGIHTHVEMGDEEQKQIVKAVAELGVLADKCFACPIRRHKCAREAT